MSQSADSARAIHGFDDAVTSLVETERNHTLFALGIFALITAMLVRHVPEIAYLAIALSLALIAKHALTRYRVRRGLFGNNRHEVTEILIHAEALRTVEPD